MPRNIALTKWQYALLIGAPIALGAGYLYYRKRKYQDVDKTSGESNDGAIDAVIDDLLSSAMTTKNKGNKYFKSGKFDEAIKYYTEAINICPEDKAIELAKCYQNRAAAYENLKDYLQVIENTTKAFELDPKYTKALYRRAKAYEQLKDYQNSLEDVTAVCILEGFQNQPALMMTDRVLKLLGQLHAKEAIKNHVPRLPSDHFITNYFSSYHCDPFEGDSEKFEEGMKGYFKAVHDFKLKKYTEIIKDCSYEIDENLSDRLKALLLRATFYLLTGQMDLAKVDLSIITAETDIDTKVLSNALIKQASIKVQDELLESCLIDFNRAIEIAPENPDVYLHRGQIYLLMNKIDSSIEDMTKAVNVAPNFAVAHIQLVYMKYRKASQSGNTTEVGSILKDFEGAHDKFPTCSEAFFLYAQVLAEQQRFDEAVKFYDKAQEIDPKNPNIFIHKGILLLNSKHDIDAAVQMISKGLEVDDTSEFGYETLGSIEVQRGNLGKAIELFEKAIKLAKTENELVHLFSLKDAALVQQKIAKKLGVNIPVMGDF